MVAITSNSLGRWVEEHSVVEVCIGPYSERRLLAIVLPVDSQVGHLDAAVRFTVGRPPYLLGGRQRVPSLVLQAI